jgi:Rieske Fe-S protein
MSGAGGPRETPDGPCPRRRALATLAGLALPAAFVAAGCRTVPAGPPPPLRIPLAELAVDRRRVVHHGGRPVEVLRTEQGVVARSMNCTHYGCLVTWSSEEALYVCSCHGGRFDPAGRPVAGPPQKPLRVLAAAIEGGEVRIGG